MRRDGLRPAGQLRQSQVVTTFGPGAMVDLPDYSAIIGGLDSWRGYQGHPIEEERLAQKVKTLLQLDQVRFYAPPPDNDDPAKPVTGIAAWLFPEWFVAQYEVRESGVRSRPLVHRSDPVCPGVPSRARQRHQVEAVRARQRRPVLETVVDRRTWD